MKNRKQMKKAVPILLMIFSILFMFNIQTYAASTPGQVKNAVISVDDTFVTLNWKKVKKATGYHIYMVGEDNQLTKVGSTKKSSFTIKKLQKSTQYTFQVFAYNKMGEGDGSNLIHGKTTNSLSSVHGRYFSATVVKKTNATNVKTKESIRMKIGTKIVAYARGAEKKLVRGRLLDGTEITIMNSKLRYGNLKTSKKTYSEEMKVEYVNDREFKSKTNYLIWVDQFTLTVNVFKGSKGKWKLIREMICVVGNGGRTTTGMYELLRTEPYKGHPKIYFSWNPKKDWGNSFHTRIGNVKQAAASHGCVRLGVSDLMFIANNCPMGTTVVCY